LHVGDLVLRDAHLGSAHHVRYLLVHINILIDCGDQGDAVGLRQFQQLLFLGVGALLLPCITGAQSSSAH
jgi:hypothetical protein